MSYGMRMTVEERRAPLMFRFEGQPVGTFKGLDAFPTTPGKFRYDPFRGLGHLKMIEACQRHGFARCTYTSAKGTVELTVRTVDEYGVLEILNLLPE